MIDRYRTITVRNSHCHRNPISEIHPLALALCPNTQKRSLKVPAGFMKIKQCMLLNQDLTFLKIITIIFFIVQTQIFVGRNGVFWGNFPTLIHCLVLKKVYTSKV